MAVALAALFCALVTTAEAAHGGPVNTLLSSSSTVVKSLSSQASALEMQVGQAEKASENKIARQQSLFETKLKTQETQNREAVAANAKISKTIKTFTLAEAALEKRNKELRSTNHVLEMELKLMKAKLYSAGDFALKSSALSLLQVVQERGAPSPDKLMDGLSKQVAQLRAQEKSSEQSVKKRFIKDYRTGSKMHAALLSKKKALIAMKTSVTKKYMALKKTEKQLLKAKAALEHNLHNLSDFLKSFARLAEAPVSQVPHMLRTMPKNVAQ